MGSPHAGVGGGEVACSHVSGRGEKHYTVFVHVCCETLVPLVMYEAEGYFPRRGVAAFWGTLCTCNTCAPTRGNFVMHMFIAIHDCAMLSLQPVEANYLGHLLFYYYFFSL